MRLSNVLVYTTLFLFTLACNTHAKELSLPSKQPELNITADKQLGTLDGEFGLAPGAEVSDFTIKDHFGKDTSLKSLVKDGPVLAIFYRGGWCPYCNRQIYLLTESWPEFEKRGITPVLISADKPDAAALASRTYEIPFPVLSDPKLVAHDLFKVTMALDAETVKKYEGYGISLSDWSGEDHNKFAVSSAFIIDKSQTVLWSHSSLDWRTRPSVEQLLSVIDSL